MSDRKKKRGLGLLDEAVDALPRDTPQELKRGAERAKRKQESLEKAEGFGATAPAQAIAEKWLPTLTESIERALTERTRSQLYPEFFAVIRGLPSDVLALSILQTALDSVAQNETKVRSAALSIADAIAGECWMRGLIKDHPDLAEQINKRGRHKPGSSKRRQQMARAQAKRAGYITKEWDVERRLQAGVWAIDQLLTVLPDVFRTVTEGEKGGPERVLVLTNTARDFARGVLSELIRRNPVWLPQTEPPLCWSDLDKGGPSDKRLSLILRVISRHSKRNDAAVREAIRDGTMAPALKALNALQHTAWTINRRVLEVLNGCADSEIGVPGGLLKQDAAVPDIPSAWESMNTGERQQWRKSVEKIEQGNRKNNAKRVLLDQDRATANILAEHARFWTPMHLDWRGRVFSVPHFAYPRDDYVRGLFLFANGETIGDEGLKWLKVHVANCGDSEKLGCKGIGKRPFIARVAWVDENLSMIKRIAEKPLKELRWTHANKPFQFLAACFELSSALTHGPTFISRLPISFDGSCSGLQHLSAMMRDADTAKLVNLTNSPLPHDLYQAVAEQVKQRVEDLKNEEHDKSHLAALWLKHGIDRNVVKRNVMTYSYGSNVKGMADQLDEDLMLPLSLNEQEHPFGDDGHNASWYLAQHTHAAIKEIANLPAKAMSFLQRLARVMAKENKPLRWMTPAGFPFVNQYSKPKTKPVKLWLHNSGTRVRHVIKTTIDELPEIDEHEAKKGAPPNFVHACDAAHLMLTVNAAVAEGITSIATVHDSFGCLPSRAEQFRKIIREEFVRMYENNDVLAQVLEQARQDLGENERRLGAAAKGLPDKPPDKGCLDIDEVRAAEYAFA